MKGTTALCGLAGTFVMLAIANLAAALVLPYWVKKGKNGVDTGLFIDCSVSDWPDDCEKFDVETILEHDRESKMTSWYGMISALLALYEVPHKGPAIRNFDGFFMASLHTLLNKQSIFRWFERSREATIMGFRRFQGPDLLH